MYNFSNFFNSHSRHRYSNGWLKQWSDFSKLFNNEFFLYDFFQSLVIAGLGDLTRPASQISMNQSATLCGANLIWSRYSLIIIPKNWSLFAVCMFTSLTQFIQLARAYNYSLSSEENEKQKIEPLIEAADATTKN